VTNGHSGEKIKIKIKIKRLTKSMLYLTSAHMNTYHAMHSNRSQTQSSGFVFKEHSEWSVSSPSRDPKPRKVFGFSSIQQVFRGDPRSCVLAVLSPCIIRDFHSGVSGFDDERDDHYCFHQHECPKFSCMFKSSPPWFSSHYSNKMPYGSKIECHKGYTPFPLRVELNC
jgi:hypothetical protein